MNLYDATIPIFTKYLANLDRWLDAAVTHAKERSFDPELYVEQRLAVDQFPLRRQVQEVCDVAKFCAAKMTDKAPPSNPDTEKTLAELRERIKTTVAYLKTFTREDFAGSEERRCSHQWMQGKAMRGGDYLDHYALPNFHFHLTTAYAILRHSGVKLGKNDFLGDLPFV
jgi:uncharacterized protein